MKPGLCSLLASHLGESLKTGWQGSQQGKCVNTCLGVPKIGVPLVIILFPYKPSIWGYPHFRKPPMKQIEHLVIPNSNVECVAVYTTYSLDINQQPIWTHNLKLLATNMTTHTHTHTHLLTHTHTHTHTHTCSHLLTLAHTCSHTHTLTHTHTYTHAHTLTHTLFCSLKTLELQFDGCLIRPDIVIRQWLLKMTAHKSWGSLGS